jgi:nitrite reductase/ring-hydroxylating ferredoxin subunit
MVGRTLEMVNSRMLQQGSVEICDVDRLWDGEMESIGVSDTTVLVLKLNGEFRAYQALCPHQCAALADGELADGLITCHAHRWQFRAADGRGVNPRSACLKRFPLHVVDGKVLIDLENASMTDHFDASGDDFVGPVLRAGDLADAVARSIEDDNPGKEVRIVDRGDYVRIHTPRLCRLTRGALERHLGQPYELRLLEIEMPAFSGRLRTSDAEFVWFYAT